MTFQEKSIIFPEAACFSLPRHYNYRWKPGFLCTTKKTKRFRARFRVSDIKNSVETDDVIPAWTRIH